MQQRTASLTVAPDPVRDLYYASRIGGEIAVKRSSHEGTVVMKHFDLCHVWRSPAWLVRHGLPKLTDYEWRVLTHIIMCGRATHHTLTWAVMRGGQSTINQSLAYEIDANYHHVSRAVTHLRRVGLVDLGYVRDRPTISVTEHFHKMMFECRWRSELRNSYPIAVDDVVSGVGWKWLVSTVDEVFRCDPRLQHTHRDDRKRAIGEARYRCWNG